MIDDFELIERWRQGDLEAADLLLRRYYPPLRRFFAAKLRDEAEREDLIQDTFQALVGAIARFGRRSSAKAFVFGIARNKLHDHLRSRYRAAGGFDPLRDSIEDLLGKSPSSHTAMLERNQHLLAAVAALAVDDQILIELSYWQDLNSPELAAIFDTTPEAVRARLFRARTALERALASSSPASLDDESPRPDSFETRFRELGLEFD